MAIFTGIATAVSGLMASTFLTGAVGSFLLKTAVGIGLNLLAQSIAGKPQEPLFAINGSLQAGGDLPRSFLIGQAATAGSLVWVNTWGKDGDTPNAYLTQVISLSDLPVGGLREVWVNGQKVTLDYNTPNMFWGWQVKEYRNGGDNLWVKFYDGTQTVADDFLVKTCSNQNRQYDVNRIGRGVAYVIVTARVSKQMFSGIPNFKFVLDGVKLYDPSKDSSVGGNGAHRWSDPSTWGGDGDHLPAVQEYNLLRGLSWNNQWLYGVQNMSSARLPSDNWIKAINKCRAPIQGASGLEPTYRAGGEITIDAPLANALEALNTSCQGRIAEIGGIYQMFLGAPDAPVIHFTDDDILSTDEQTFTPFFGLSDTINGVSATYPSASDGWVLKSAPSLFRADLEALHGNRRLMAKVELNFVPYAEQVQRLMKSALEEGQRARRHTLVIPPRFWAYAVPGVTWSWTSKRNGYVNKLMRIDGSVDRANLDVLADMTEVDPSDSDWHSGSDYKPPVDGAVGAMRPQPMPIISFAALPAVAQDSKGNNRRVGIQLFWDGSVNAVDFVQYEVRKTETLETIYIGRTEEVPRASLIIAPGTLLLPNQSYQVHARYGTYDGNTEFLWSDWIQVITADIRLGELDIYPINVEQLNKDVGDTLKQLADTGRYVQEELDRIGALAVEQEAGTVSEFKLLREEAVVTASEITAAYTKLVTVSIGPGSAIAKRIETLEAKIDDDVVKAVSLLATDISKIDGKVAINSAAITSLSAQLSDKADSSAMSMLAADISRVDDKVAINSAAITSLSAQMSNKADSTAVSLLDAKVNQQGELITAHANSITLLNSTVDNFSAEGLIRITSEATSGSALSRIAFRSYVEAMGRTSQAAMWLEAYSGAGGELFSRMVTIADQWIVTNGVDSAYPMTFVNGELTLGVVNVGTAYFDVLQSRNGKIRMRGHDNFADLRLFS